MNKPSILPLNRLRWKPERLKRLNCGSCRSLLIWKMRTDGPLLLEVNSIEGQIGAMTYTPETQFGSKFHWGGMGMVSSKTVVAVPSKGKYRSKIWQTRDTTEAEKIHLSTHTLRLEERIQFSQARAYEGPIKAGSTKAFVLNKSRQTYELLLTRGLVAFVWDGKHTRALVAAHSNTQESITVPAENYSSPTGGMKQDYSASKGKEKLPRLCKSLTQKRGLKASSPRQEPYHCCLRRPKTGKNSL